MSDPDSDFRRWYYIDTRLKEPGDGSKEHPFNDYALYEKANKKEPRDVHIIFAEF